MANIAIMGFGRIGGGVAEVLQKNQDVLSARLGEPLRLKYILDVRDLSASPYADKVVKDVSVLENDGGLDVVVECIGGVGAALDFTRRLLSRGKHVVTSNKELVAAHGRELLDLARSHGVKYLFEASVGGGIPLLGPLSGSLGANRIEEITGILNGTTNYILTRMEQDNLDFIAALNETRRLGYAERDASADTEGLDAGRKICILASLAWGCEVPPDEISIRGILGTERLDAMVARRGGYTIKLLGRALRMPNGKRTVYVSRHLVPCSHPLASAEGVFNAVMVRGSEVGDVMFYGRGAGALPTASAVLGDVLDILEGKARQLGWGGRAEDLVNMETDLPLYWYLRGDFTPPPVVERLSEGGVITSRPMVAVEALKLAKSVGAKALFPVLR